MTRSAIITNGILSDASDQFHWTRELAFGLERPHGVFADTFQYSVGPLTKALRVREYRKLLTRKLHQRDGDYLIAIGHSWGCHLLCEALKADPGLRINDLHLFCAATSPDFDANGLNDALSFNRVGRVFVYGGPDDRALNHPARLSRWLTLGFGGFGDLGRVGCTNVEELIADRVHCDFRDGYDHGDWFSEQNFGDTLSLIAATIPSPKAVSQ